MSWTQAETRTLLGVGGCVWHSLGPLAAHLDWRRPWSHWRLCSVSGFLLNWKNFQLYYIILINLPVSAFLGKFHNSNIFCCIDSSIVELLFNNACTLYMYYESEAMFTLINGFITEG